MINNFLRIVPILGTRTKGESMTFNPTITLKSIKKEEL